MSKDLKDWIYTTFNIVEKMTRYLMYVCVFLAVQLVVITALYFILMFFAADILHSQSMVQVIVTVFNGYTNFMISCLDILT